MKNLMAAAAIATLAAASSWAVTNTFHITQFRGVLTDVNGNTMSISVDDLSTNHMIMVVSDNAHEVVISEVSGTATNLLMDQRHAAFTKGGKFNSAMRGNFIPFSSFVPAFLGDLQFTGKLSPSGTNTPKKVSASVIGVWTENTDTTFKGNLQGQVE
jgi:hypothetical protein